MKLEAMRLEAIGDLEQAGKIYDELIKREPTLAGLLTVCIDFL